MEVWLRHQGPLHRCFWFCCPCCKPKKVPHKQVHLSEDLRHKPGCCRRLLWCFCPCMKPEKVHPIHLADLHKRQTTPDVPAPQTFHIGQKVLCRRGAGDWIEGHVTSLSPLEAQPNGWSTSCEWEAIRVWEPTQAGKVKLGHSANLNRLKKDEVRRWRCCAVCHVLLQTVVTLAAIAPNAIMVYALLEQQEWNWLATPCGGFPIDWIFVFIGNIGIGFVAVVLRIIWFIGGMNMANSHRVKASDLESRIRDGDDGQQENWHKELRLGQRKAERGFTISARSNCFLNLLLFIFVGWCVVGWLRFVRSEGDCTTEKGWWPYIFGGMLFWSILIKILQCVQAPLK